MGKFQHYKPLILYLLQGAPLPILDKIMACVVAFCAFLAIAHTMPDDATVGKCISR